MKNRKNIGTTMESTEQTEKKLKLDYGQTFKVGIAFAGIILFWNAYDFVIPLLLEHAYGLPNALRGLIMGLDNLLALFMLPLFGKISDNAKGKLARKFGRRTPFIVIGTVCAVILMIFVPVATLGQQKAADEYSNSIEAQLNDDQWMESHLAEWYDNAVSGEGEYYEVELEYLANNNMSREDFINIRFDEKLTSKKALLLFGEETFYYDGEEITDLNAVAPTGRTYQEIIDSNKAYKTFVASSVNGYISDGIYENHTQTKAGISSIAVYMVILLLVLVAMASFRSPAVALMPDVTPKPLRSQANAIINLCGGIGGAIAFLIYTVVLFGERLHNYVIIFGSVAGGMLLLLAAFIALVNEKKMVKRCQEICEEYGIDDYEDQEEAKEPVALDEKVESDCNDATLEESVEVAADVEDTPEISPEVLEIAKAKTAKIKSPKEWWSAKSTDEKQRLKSFWLILASIFMWFMGYNAVSSNLSVYTTKALNLSAGISSIISGASMVVSAIAFIPVGYMAVKLGRRKSIIIGFALAVASFILVCFAVRPSDNATIPSVLFTVFYLLAGFGLIIANVNTFPMVTELSTAETVGQYTGYYYVATMSAQAITPMIGGAVMDAGQDKYLFLYSAVCIVIAIVLMCFVKHGDSKQIPTGKKLTKEEKKQIRLDALENLD
ncbi:MAG: MFS transporter [Clostridia bacterium]|nr:MFS transporter [Clostridia bacterium]